MSRDDRQDLSTMGEIAMVERIRQRLQTARPEIECGPGDDAAIVRFDPGRLVLTSDSQREGVHFRKGWISPTLLGRRALAVSVSDLAAMGADPVCALCTLALPGGVSVGWVDDLLDGMATLAEAIACPIVGGDVARVASGISIEITAVGRLAPGRSPLLRSGARPGDGCWVTGIPGLAGAGRVVLEAGEPVPREDDVARAIDAYRRPVLLLSFGAAAAARRVVSAAMDLSDGLAIDASRMCAASGAGLRLSAAALVHPLLGRLAISRGQVALDWALGGGDDYGLLCAVASEAKGRFEALAAAHEVSVCRVGTFTAAELGMRLELEDGSERPLEPRGWDHFGRFSR